MKKILIINWRDPQSPLEGGAERFTLKFAEHWSEKGHQVFWLTNTFSEMNQKETKINGVNFIRISPNLDGSLLRYVFYYPIYLLKTIMFADKFIKKENIDIVIDEIHGLPFFTPLFSKARNILLTCEVAGPIWDRMFPWPINVFGKKMEKIIYLIYKKNEIITISDNTKKNIRTSLPRGNIKKIDLGIDHNPKIIEFTKKISKTSYPSAAFLARLVKMKGVESAISATALITKKMPDFKLFIMGSGRQRDIESLKNKAKKMKIESNVVFLGKVSEQVKYEYLKKAHCLFNLSYKEGFGLTVLEAGLVGTPTIARSDSGLNELIKQNYNGFLFNFDKEISEIFIENEKKMNFINIEKNCILNAKKYYWPKVLGRSEKVFRII